MNKRKKLLLSILASLVIAIITYYLSGWIESVISLVTVFALIKFAEYTKVKLKESSDIKKMEEAFPDFLELVSSNLRAGMTIDRSLLLSSREEFEPLTEEITKLGKDIITGKNIEKALEDLTLRIKSEKIRKNLALIISGIRSGGNLATILEQTAENMRERYFLEKRTASNVLMYVIFIFFAVAVGAPVLFALSSVLVSVLTKLLATIPNLDASSVRLPFTLTKITISPAFVTYFSLVFLVVIDILGSLVLGLVSKGNEKEGLKYTLPLIALSVVIFLTVRIVLLHYFSGIIG